MTIDVVADEQACFLLTYACSDPDAVEIHVDGALQMQWYRPPELDGAVPSGTRGSAPVSYCHHTHELSDGPHQFSLEAVCDGTVTSDSVTATTTAPDFRIAALTADRPWYAAGDTIVLELDAAADGLTVTGDFSDVDPDYRTGNEQVTALGGGRYEIAYMLGRNVRPKRGVASVAVSDGSKTKQHALPILALRRGYPRAGLATGTFSPDPAPWRPEEANTAVRDVVVGLPAASSTEEPAMFDDTSADVDGARIVTLDYVGPGGLLAGDLVDVQMRDPARDGHFASRFEITAVNCPRQLAPMCEYDAKGFLQESPHQVAPGNSIGQAEFRVVFGGTSATPWSGVEDLAACPECGGGTIYVTGNIRYEFDRCRPDASQPLSTSPQIYGSTCTIENRPARKLLVEVSAIGSKDEVILQKRTYADATGGFQLNMPDTAAERPHVVRVWSITPKVAGERIAVGQWTGSLQLSTIGEMTSDPADYDVHWAQLASITPKEDAVETLYGYLMDVGQLTIRFDTDQDMAWATHIIDEMKRGIDYFGTAVDTSKMHGINVCWQSYDVGPLIYQDSEGKDTSDRYNQNRTSIHPAFIYILPESTDAFVFNHELAHYFHREYQRLPGGYGRFDEPMAHVNAGMIAQHNAPAWAKNVAGTSTGSWMPATVGYASSKETLDFNAHFNPDDGTLEQSDLQFFPDHASYIDCSNRPECCSDEQTQAKPLCVMGRYGFLHRIFWDLHDGTDLELWAPNGVADEFDQVDGGSSLHDIASHKLLDVLFGYLGGKKHAENPDYADRGIEDIDHVDVLDGMMCRGHMTEPQAQEMLHDVMNYAYDFTPPTGQDPCPN